MSHSGRTTQVRLSRETANTLRRLAADLGYVQTRGIMAGELGSIAQMMDAIARGDLHVFTPDRPDSSAANSADPDNSAS